MKRLIRHDHSILHLAIGLLLCSLSGSALSQPCGDSVKITYSPAVICPGIIVAFHATAPQGATNPHFQWVYNGAFISYDISTYTTNSLKTGDIVKCIFTGINCQGYSFTSADSVIISESPVSKPSISISTGASYICKGSSATFIATSQNGGPHPSYQWKVNGVGTGANTDTFFTSTLNNGDVVSCVLTADPLVPCILPKTVSSYGISIKVASSIAPSIRISSSANDICPGTPVTFTATVENASSQIFYQWKLNKANTGTDSSNYTTNTLANGDEIYCMVTDTIGCSRAPASSEKLIINVKPLPEITLNPLDTIVAPGTEVMLRANISGSILSFQWQPSQNLSDTSSLSPTTHPLSENTNYFFDVITSDGCSVTKEITIRIFSSLNMPNAFTPNGDGHNDVFRIPANSYINLREFAIFNRLGDKIFSTSDISEGWDGTVDGKKQDTGAYIYLINGTTKNGKVVYKGSFLLIR
jgi:gliding motility-associated-like protein